MSHDYLGLLESSVWDRVESTVLRKNIILGRIHWRWCVLHVWFEQHILLWCACVPACGRVYACACVRVLHAIRRRCVPTCASAGVWRLCVFDWSSALSGSDVTSLTCEKHCALPLSPWFLCWLKESPARDHIIIFLILFFLLLFLPLFVSSAWTQILLSSVSLNSHGFCWFFSRYKCHF